MMYEMTFDYDKKRTTVRFPRKAFMKANGEESIKKMQGKLDGIDMRMNSRYVYVDFPFNLMTGEVTNDLLRIGKEV